MEIDEEGHKDGRAEENAQEGVPPSARFIGPNGIRPTPLIHLHLGGLSRRRGGQLSTAHPYTQPGRSGSSTPRGGAGCPLPEAGRLGSQALRERAAAAARRHL